MTAALYALRNGKTALILEKEVCGGQITSSPRVENIPGFPVLSGNEFGEKLFDQVMEQGADFELEEAVSVRDSGSFKTVTAASGASFDAKTVILANGVTHRLPAVEGAADLVGKGISFCAVCDGDFYQGKDVCLLGGGNSALQEGIFLAARCRSVTILQDLPELTGEPTLREQILAKENVKVYTQTALTGFLTENGVFKGVKVRLPEGEKEFLCDGLFVAIGLIPRNRAFENVAPLDGRGYYDAGEDCLTPTPGVFCAGDCRRKEIRQVTTACADGAVAALAACRFIDRM